MQQTLCKVRMRRGIKIVGQSLLVLLVIFLVVCTVNEIRQRIIVNRAAALLSDMHSLHLRQSNWKDAQRLMARWGRWGHYDGACTTQDCFYVITLDSSATPHQNMLGWASRTSYYLSAFRLLPRQWGGGLRVMQTMFLVQDSVIVRSGIEIEIAQSGFAKGATWGAAELVMSVSSHPSLGSLERGQNKLSSRHPDYTRWTGHLSDALIGRVTYADSMSSEEAARLSDFQLSCVTRWSSCLTLEELAPAAFARDWGDPPEKATYQPTPIGCALPLYALGRDASRVVPIEALEDGVSLGKDCDGIEHESSRVRVLAPLKGDSQIGSVQKVISSESWINGDGYKPTHLVRDRHYLLMLEEGDSRIQDGISLGNCKIIEDDAVSDQEIRRGIAMDDRLKAAEPTISLNGFARRSGIWQK